MIFEKRVGLIAEQFNVEADSITMDIVDLSMALEEEFGIEELAEEEITTIVTVGDLVRFLQNKLD